jgi:hypothetical protein
MKQVVIATVSAGVLAASALSLAATAAAVPTGGASAADTAMMLMRQGYNVAFNGATAMPLSRCNDRRARADAKRSNGVHHRLPRHRVPVEQQLGRSRYGGDYIGLARR